MMFKQAALGLTLSLALMATAAKADMVFQSPHINSDICANIPGAWSGQGKVSARILGVKITCQYKGTATAVLTSTPYNYEFHVNLNKISGICPDSRSVVVTGFCDPIAGLIVLSSSDANLTGTLSADGRSANVVGKVNVPVAGQTVTADVEGMELKKQ